MNRQVVADSTSADRVAGGSVHVFEYDRLGQRVTDSHSKWVDAQIQNVRLEYTYDALGRQSTTVARTWTLKDDGLTVQAGEDSMVIDRRFYDARGNLIQSGRGEAYPPSAPSYTGVAAEPATLVVVVSTGMAATTPGARWTCCLPSRSHLRTTCQCPWPPKVPGIPARSGGRQGSRAAIPAR